MSTVRFDKIALDISNKCEAAAAFDVDNDGIIDIVCGEYWYQGPDFRTRHKICDIQYDGNYIWDFSDYPMDVNGDGYLDIITASWWGEGIYWRENPGPSEPGKPYGAWTTHKIMELGSVETVRYFDIDGDGQVEIFPNCPGMPVFFLKLQPDGTFARYDLTEQDAGHGLGFGDIDGDGKPEILIPAGILHMNGDDPFAPWTLSAELDLQGAIGVPMLVHDVNGDGLADIIYSAGHAYGLFWLEQGRDAAGNRSWTRHVIDGAWSQYHDMQLVDIDGDGELELVTGKRYKAHNGNDVGDAGDVFVCYYKPLDGTLYRHMIDFGPADGTHSGVGIYFWTADLTGNGKLDIVAPGKEGLFLFLQR